MTRIVTRKSDVIYSLNTPIENKYRVQKNINSVNSNLFTKVAVFEVEIKINIITDYSNKWFFEGYKYLQNELKFPIIIIYFPHISETFLICGSNDYIGRKNGKFFKTQYTLLK